MIVVYTPGGPQTLACVTEAGLYRILMRSNSQNARQIQDWVTQVVLPSIRKTGGYVMGQEKVVTGELSMEEMTLRVLQFQANLVEKLKADVVRMAEGRALSDAKVLQMEAVVAEQAPKVDFYDDVAASDRTTTLSEVAKLLHLPVRDGIAWMREAVPIWETPQLCRIYQHLYENGGLDAESPRTQTHRAHHGPGADTMRHGDIKIGQAFEIYWTWGSYWGVRLGSLVLYSETEGDGAPGWRWWKRCPDPVNVAWAAEAMMGRRRVLLELGLSGQA